MKNEQKLTEKIKEWRVVSISALIFISWQLDRVIDWFMSSSVTELGEGLAVTGILGAIAAMWRFTLQFAAHKSENKENSLDE